MNRNLIYCFCLLFAFLSCKSSKNKVEIIDKKEKEPENKVETIVEEAEPAYFLNKRGDRIEILNKSEEQWEKELTKEEYYVLRKKGTERAFTGDLFDNKQEGLYTCAACDMVLFSSNAKYDSGTGWPSFFRPDDETVLKLDTDYDLGYPRTEVMCRRCGGHLGHVFNDGPPPTGLRYCINSVALDFVPALNNK